MAAGNIHLGIDDGLATITINRPEAKNSLNLAALQELHAALGVIEDRPDVGALVLTGAGDAFCAGVNLKGYDLDDREAFRAGFREVAMWWHQMLHRVVRLPMPVLAAVNGVAVGGGLGLTLAADMAICNETARFYASWMSNGIANDGGSSYSLTRIVGFRRAMELMLSNRTLDAAEALEWGIVNRVYEGPLFAEMRDRIGHELAQGPTHLQAMVKETLHDGWRRSLEEATEHECMNILDSLDDPYAAERLAAFARGERTDSIQVVF
ncbi:MAG: enoyl-CoA hydratase/isomerase family protein [Acidimicrobiia bacterium]